MQKFPNLYESMLKSSYSEETPFGNFVMSLTMSNDIGPKGLKAKWMC